MIKNLSVSSHLVQGEALYQVLCWNSEGSSGVTWRQICPPSAPAMISTDCRIRFGGLLTSPAWRQMALAGSLRTSAIIRQNQIHTIGMEIFTVQKQGQKDEPVLSWIFQVERDWAVKWALTSEDSELWGLSNAYFALHWQNLSISLFYTFQIGLNS